MSEEKKKVIFHVVNSNSEKCKNTEFSILLTHHYSYRKKEPAYFIDLDWNNPMNEEKYTITFSNEEDRPYYIDEMMMNFKNKANKKYIYWFGLGKHLNNKRIPGCVANPMLKNEIKLSEVELDLFENTIFNIINELTAKEISKNEKIHFILDLPTKNDLHSDKIIHHLLLDQSSPLYKKFNFGSYQDIAEYEVIFYMLTDERIPNHLQNTKYYLDNLILSSSYSSIIDELNRNDKLKVYYFSNSKSSIEKLNTDNGIRNIEFKMHSFERHDIHHFKTLISKF